MLRVEGLKFSLSKNLRRVGGEIKATRAAENPESLRNPASVESSETDKKHASHINPPQTLKTQNWCPPSGERMLISGKDKSCTNPSTTPMYHPQLISLLESRTASLFPLAIAPGMRTPAALPKPKSTIPATCKV